MRADGVAFLWLFCHKSCIIKQTGYNCDGRFQQKHYAIGGYECATKTESYGDFMQVVKNAWLDIYDPLYCYTCVGCCG